MHASITLSGHRLVATLCAAAVLSCILAASPAAADDRRTDRSRLVLMTLNAEFLWDGLPPEEGQPKFPWKGSPTLAAEHMRRVAAIVTRADPDILNLCEVENEDALRLFNDTFLAGRGYVAYFVQGKDTSTGQDVALLTRLDPEGDRIERYDRKGQAGDMRKEVSKNWFARFTAGDMKFSVVGVHLLALPTRPDRRQAREAQAQAVRKLAVGLVGDGWPVAVMGDFNDYDGAADALDHLDSQPISVVLASIRAMDPSDPRDDLVNAASRVAKAQRYTSWWDRNENGRVDGDRETTSIDHVLLSPALAARVESVTIPHDHDLTTVTDHFPIVVRLRTGKVR